MLHDLGFTPCQADPDIWIRDAGDKWEYVCVYVDDLLTALKDAKAFFEILQSDKYQYKLKGVGPPEYHLGGDFTRDSDGTLSYSAKTYIKCMVENFEFMFGEK